MFNIRHKAVTPTLPNANSGKGLATDATQSVAQYGLPQVSYSTEDLEIHEPGSTSTPQMPTVGKASSPRNLLAFSRRKAMMVSVAITVVVMLLTGTTMVLLTKKSTKSDKSAQATVQSQDISLKDADLTVLPDELQGASKSLTVNGDLVTTGTLKISNNTFVSILKTDNLTANQTYTLPNASGTICLDSNNCNFVTTATLQASNTSVSLPQNLTTTGSPQFTSLSLTTLTPNAVVYTTGTGSLASIASTSTNQCLLSTAGAPVFGACSNGSVADVNGLTGSVTILPEFERTTVTTGVGTITIGLDPTHVCTDDPSSPCVVKNSDNTYIQFAPTVVQADGSCWNNPACGLTPTTTIYVGKTTTVGNIIKLQGVDTDCDSIQPACLGSLSDAFVIQGDGRAFFRSLTANPNAFQVQNANGEDVFNVSTEATYNLIDDASFEIDPCVTYVDNDPDPDVDDFVCILDTEPSAGVNQWVPFVYGTVTSPTISWNQDIAREGFRSATIQSADEQASGKPYSSYNHGIYYPVALSASQTYSMSFWVNKPASTTTAVSVLAGYYGTDINSKNECTVNSKTAYNKRVTLLADTWQLVTCTFTPVASSNGVYVLSKGRDAEWFIDNFILVEGLKPVVYNGAADVSSQFNVKADSATAFSVQSSGSTVGLLDVNTEEGLTVIRPLANNTSALQVRNTENAIVLDVIAGEAGSLGEWQTASKTIYSANPKGRNFFQGATATNAYNETFGYVIGGKTGSSTATDTVRYAKLNGDGEEFWQDGKNGGLPLIANHAVVSAKGYIYLIGGQGSGYPTAAYNSVYYNKIDSNGNMLWDNWQLSGSTLNSARTGIQGTYYNGYIYVFGGNSPTSSSSRLDTVEYAKVNADGTLGAWTVSPSLLPNGLSEYSAVTSGGYIYLMGGTENGTGVTSRVVHAHVVGPLGVLDSWIDTSSLVDTRKNSAAVVRNGYIYLFGGGGNIKTYEIGSIDASGEVGEWISNNFIVDGSPKNRIAPGALVYDETIYVLGGSTSSPQTNPGSVYFTTAAAQSSAVSLFGSLTVTQSATFNGGLKVSTTENTTSAFNVQNSTDGELFNIDSLNSIIRLNGLNSGEVTNWNSTSSLNTGREGTGSAIVNGYLYAVSGNSSNIVEYAKIRTDGTVEDWIENNDTPQHLLPDYKNHAATISYNGYIYIVGGYDSANNAPCGDSSCPSNLIYYGKPNSDGSVSVWKTAANTLNTGVGSPAASIYNGYLYISGGGTSSTGGVPDSPTEEVQVAKLNPDGSVGVFNSFVSPNPGSLPSARVGGRSVVANGKLYFIGGTDGVNAQPDVYYADLSAGGGLGAFTVNGVSPSNVAYHTSILVNGYIYVLGGTTTDYSSSGADTVYFGKLTDSGEIEEWKVSTESLADPVFAHATATANGFIYVIGGNGNRQIVTRATTSRVAIGGSLDLVGLGSRTLSDAGGGGQLTAGNTTIVGTLDVRDSANFTQSLSVEDSFTAHGQVLLQNNVNSSNAFRVLYNNDSTAFGIDTSTGEIIIGNPGGFTATISSSALMANRVLTLPDADGEICLSSGNCIGGGAGSDLQDAYDAGNTILTGDATDIAFSLSDTATDAKFTVNLLGTGSAVEFLDSGTVVASIVDGGAVLLHNTVNSTSALAVKNLAGNDILSVDTTNGLVVVGNVSNVNLASLDSSALTINRTYTFPNMAGEICVDSGNCFGTGTGIDLQYAYDEGHTIATTDARDIEFSLADTTTDSKFTVNIQGTGNTFEILDGGVAFATFADGGTTTLSGNTAVNTTTTTAFRVQTAGGASTLLSADTSNMRVSVGSIGTPTGQLYVSGLLPTAPIGTVATQTLPRWSAIQGKYLYQTNFISSTMQIFDISNPASPVALSSIATGTSPRGIAVSGRYAYVVNSSSNTMTIYDISNPLSPVQVTGGSIATGTLPYDVDVVGSYAYIINYIGNTLQIINISNPASPVVVGSVATGTNPNWITINGRYAYITSAGSNTLAIYDISNPSAPASAGGSIVTGLLPTSVAVDARYAYVINQSGNSLQIFDISNPASIPAALGSVATGTTPRMISVQGRYAYVINNGSSTLQLIDISNVTSPTSIGTVATSAGPLTLTVNGRYAYVGNQTANNLEIFDLGGIYAQQLEAGGIETSTLQVTNNFVVANNGSIQGGLNVSGSLQVGNGAGFNGATIFNTGAVGTTALTLQGIASQTADLMQARDSSNNVLFRVSSAGVTGTIDVATAATSSRAFELRSGNATGSGNSDSGTLTLSTGTATSDSGALLVSTGGATNGTSGAITVVTGNAPTSGALAIGSGAGSGVGGTSGGVTISSGTSAQSSTGQISIITGSTSPNATSQSSGLILLDTGAVTSATNSILAQTGQIILSTGGVQFYANNGGYTTGSITLQSGGCNGICVASGGTAPTLSTGSVNIQVSAGMHGGTTGDINIGTSGVSNTIQIGNTSGAVAQTINIGNNTTGSSTNNVTVGSTIGTSSLTLQSGSGGITLTGVSTFSGNLLPNAAGTLDLGSSSLEFDELYLGDNNGLKLGLDQDATLAYDEAGDDRVELTGTGASLFIEDRLSLGTQTFTMSTAGAATENLTPTASYVEITGQDNPTDLVQIQTASAKKGDVLIINNTSATDVSVDQNGTTKLSGGVDVLLTQYDVIMLIFDGTNWLQIGAVTANS